MGQLPKFNTENEEHNHFHLLSDIVLTHVIVIHLQAVHTVLAHHKCGVKNIGTILT